MSLENILIKENTPFIDYKDTDYTFLDSLNNNYSLIYYNLLRNVDDRILKNIYQFLWLRSIKIDMKYPTHDLRMKNNKKELNPDIFNLLLREYCTTTLKCILIMNNIMIYFYPKLRNIKIH